jgi:beta-glucuronidase
MLYPQTNSARECVSLDGIWQLAYDEKHRGLAGRFFARMPRDVEEVAVPASLNEQVLGSRKYNHMDWVWYFRRFEAPAAWHGRRIFLRFGSVNFRAEVFLNGRRLGAHEGGYMPFEFELGDALRFGRENFLAVRVDNLLGNCTVPQGNLDPGVGGVAGWRRDNHPNVHYDFFPFTGIHRPVTLYSTGAAKLERVFLETLDLKGRRVSARLRGSFSGPAGEVRVAIPELAFEESLRPVRGGRFAAALELNGVTPWSPASPRLYRVEVSLLRDGRLLDTYSLPFGFRTFKASGTRLLLNGKPVYLRGFAGTRTPRWPARASTCPTW